MLRWRPVCRRGRDKMVPESRGDTTHNVWQQRIGLAATPDRHHQGVGDELCSGSLAAVAVGSRQRDGVKSGGGFRGRTWPTTAARYSHFCAT